jgi:hypothetical protein
MEAATTFEDLIVWQKAHACVLKVYRLWSGFPREEVYGSTAQIRRAAISIPANIAEGFKRRGRLRSFDQFRWRSGLSSFSAWQCFGSSTVHSECSVILPSPSCILYSAF